MKYYKNLATAILVVLLVLGSNLKTNAMSSNNEMDRVNFAKEAISSYIKNQDLNEKNDLSRYFDDISKEYLNTKVAVFNHNNTINNIHKTNYDIEFILLDKTMVQRKTLLKFQAISTWNYLDDLEEESSQSREIHILFDENIDSNKIVDIYSPFDSFDEVERGEFLDILNTQNGINSIMDMDLDELELKYKDKIDYSYKEQIEQISSNSIENNNSIQSTVNRSAIVSYARNNYSRSSPNSGNGVVPYYDFSQLTGNYDCTNFVSHSLLAGGVPVLNNGNPSTGWYYVSLNNRSHSWSGVVPFHNVTITRSIVPTRSSKSYTVNHIGVNNWYLGDVIQFHNGSIWRHSAVVTSTYNFKVGGIDAIGARVTGRTSRTSNNNNQRVEEIYPGNSKRVISFGG